MELKVRVSQHAHLWAVESFDLGRLADADRRDQVANFEPHVRHHKAKHHEYGSVDHLHDELREVAVEQPADAVRPIQLHEPVAHHTVPTRTVLTGGEDADRQHAPDAAGAVHGDRTDGIVDASPFQEKDRRNHEEASHCPDDRRAYGAHKGTGRRNRHKTGKHTIAAHRRIGLETLQHEGHHGGHRPDTASQHGVHHDEADAQLRPGKRRARVEAEPAEGKNKSAQNYHGHVMSRYGLRPTLSVILPDTGAYDHST